MNFLWIQVSNMLYVHTYVCTVRGTETFSAECRADYPHIFVLCSEVLRADN